MPIATVADLLAALKLCRLLTPEQADALAKEALPADPRAAARLFVQRAWLTPFQVNELFLGRGAGLLLGSYVLLECVGEGGMGQVYKARNWKLGQLVALKLIRKERLANPNAVKRFYREIRIAAKLQHPHIVRAYDADEVNGTHFFVMEFVEGTDLHKVVKNQGPLTVRLACDYIRQAALGLQHAHANDMVHRDIKPHNLLLTTVRSPERPNGAVKILDMGLALVDTDADGEHSSTMTQEGYVMGTPDYIAPEQGMDSHNVDIRADLYSLGCTFYFLLTGKAPFPGGSLMEKLLKHQQREPKPIREIRNDVPEAVAAVVAKLMAKQAADRHQTPAELAEALEEIQPQLIDQPAVPLTIESTTSIAERQLAQPMGPSATDLLARNEWAQIAPTPAPKAPLPAAPSGHWIAPVVGGIAVLLILAIGLWWTTRPGAEKKKGEEELVITLPPRPKIAQPVNGGKDDPKLVNGLEVGAPVTDAWIKAVQALPAEKQGEAVFAKLKALNPDFDDRHQGHKVTIKNNQVLRMTLGQPITDAAPLRALAHLEYLNCDVTGSVDAPAILSLADLSPLKTLPLKQLHLRRNRVEDLLPLAGMKLETLTLNHTRVRDLKALAGMTTLTRLNLNGTDSSDLTPLAGLKLTHLFCFGTLVKDVKPLAGMPLVELDIAGTQVRDLAPLNLGQLQHLNLTSCPIDDLTPLAVASALKTLYLEGVPFRSLEPLKNTDLHFIFLHYDPKHADQLRAVPVKMINRQDSADFWKIVGRDPEHEKWRTEFAALPAAEQLPRVLARFAEMNPGCEAKATKSKQDDGVVLVMSGKTRLLDLRPVAVLKHLLGVDLRTVVCTLNFSLEPLRGLTLDQLNLPPMPHFDVAPLAGMPVAGLSFATFGTTSDGTPLSHCHAMRAFGARLTYVDATFFRGMVDLRELNFESVAYCPRDLTPLNGLKKLERIILPYDDFRHREPLRAMTWLKTINNKKADEFWKESAEQQIEFVRREMKRLNPGFNATFAPEMRANGDLWLILRDDHLADLSPLRALPNLKLLSFGAATYGKTLPLKTLTPLADLKLTHLEVYHCPELKSLEPIRKLPLVSLRLVHTGIEDLGVLREMPTLIGLSLHYCPVRDLSAIRKLALGDFAATMCPVQDLRDIAHMKLTQIYMPFEYYRDAEWVRKMTTLGTINSKPAAEFWKEVDAKQAAFDAWCVDVAKLPADKQAQAVADELKKRNPSFDGKYSADLSGDGRSVGIFRLETSQIEDIAPLRALPALNAIVANSNKPSGGRLANLWPLRRMSVARMSLDNNPIRDLGPLAEVKGLYHLNLDRGHFEDLSPLAGALSLTQLSLLGAPVKDLTPLAKLKLTHLTVTGTNVTDLSALKGMSLVSLNVNETRVSDLGPIEGAPLEKLNCAKSGVKNLNALQNLKFKHLIYDFVPWRDSALVRGFSTLQTFNDKPVKEAHAWANWEDAVRAAPPKQQIEMLKAKLVEVNGKEIVVTAIGAVAVAKETIVDLRCMGYFKDISPVHAFRDLHSLALGTGSYVGPKAALIDLAPLAGMKLKRLSLLGSDVVDLGPLRGMELQWLDLGATKVVELEPLRGMPLQALVCNLGPLITSLEPLRASKLETLYCNSNPKLTSLKGLEHLPLKWLDCASCPITSLDAIKDCPLEHLSIGNGTQVTNFTPLAGIKTLKALHFVNNWGPADLSQLKGFGLESVILPANVRDLFFLKDMSIKKFSGPFDAWRDTDTMRSLKLLESVTVAGAPAQTWTAIDFWKKVESDRAGFDAWVKKVAAMKPEEQIKAVSAELLRRNPGLKETEIGKDWKLSLDQKAVIAFEIRSAEVANLEPLRALPDLETLLVYSGSGAGKLTNLWPVQGLRLKYLDLGSTAVEDLRPLAGMPLQELKIAATRVADLTPLLAVPIRELWCSLVLVRDAPILRQMKSLKTINGKAAAEVLR